MSANRPEKNKANPFRNRRRRILGATAGRFLQWFFGANALFSIIVLLLITIFLFREGIGFFPQNLQNLKTYRKTGLECIDYMRQQEQDFMALTRFLNDVRRTQYAEFEAQGLSFDEINDRLGPVDDFIYDFEDAIFPLSDLVADLTDEAAAIREAWYVSENNAELKASLSKQGRTGEAGDIDVSEINLIAGARMVEERKDEYFAVSEQMMEAIRSSLTELERLEQAASPERLQRFRELCTLYVERIPETMESVREWSPDEPVSRLRAVTSFFTGTQWVTNSFFQDIYGILPLLTGSILVSIIALTFAIPLGVGAAIYVNQVATSKEQAFIKPVIEFIAAIPSVVMGFFGVVVFGEFIRAMSETGALSWLPFFPMSERLNAFTAGCLLALMAIPTIFTLSEDALNNVPKAFTEASLAVGATRFQTIVRIVFPTALSGIISAVLLGFGRVIGETMVVLLCAGNRIAIPDFSQGLGVFFQPVHTMTGIVAQEMGEVVRGSLHYRSLFLVGIVLFCISLLINFIAQKIMHRYRMHGG